MNLTGKIALVTGGGAGLGRVFSRALAAAGASVVVADIDEGFAKDTANEVAAAGGIAIALHLDASDPVAIETMAETIRDEFGGLDILVNNAGWRPQPAGQHYDFVSQDVTPEQWLRIMQINMLGPLLCARAVRPLMVARGGGAIVNMTSLSAFDMEPGPYGISKMGLRGVSAQLAIELAPDNIRVNALAPTAMTQRGDASIYQSLLDRQLIKRLGTPEDLVGPLMFFCSDASAFITGETLLVDGGLVLRR